MLAVIIPVNLIFVPATRSTFWAGIPLVLPLVALAGSLALVLASLTVIFRDVEHLLTAVLLPWFFLTPVFYTFDLPGIGNHPALVDAIHYGNPVAPFVLAIRDPLFFGRSPARLIVATWRPSSGASTTSSPRTPCPSRTGRPSSGARSPLTTSSRPLAWCSRPRSSAASLGGALTPLLVRAARLEPVERTPVWFMRQAGRSLPGYREIRKRHNLFEVCRQPELCAEVTLEPVRVHGVDAAVMFADIMLPILGMGIDVELVENVGPVIDRPVRTAADVEALRVPDPEEAVPFILEAVRLVRSQLEPEQALVGFCGGPFTVAGYLVEGSRPATSYRRSAACTARPRSGTA